MENFEYFEKRNGQCSWFNICRGGWRKFVNSANFYHTHNLNYNPPPENSAWIKQTVVVYFTYHILI